MKELIKYIGLFGSARIICKYLKTNNLIHKIENEWHPLIHAEICALLFSIMYTIQNIPSILLSISATTICNENHRIAYIHFGRTGVCTDIL